MLGGCEGVTAVCLLVSVCVLYHGLLGVSCGVGTYSL